jgi:hypothetical protein
VLPSAEKYATNVLLIIIPPQIHTYNNVIHL